MNSLVAKIKSLGKSYYSFMAMNACILTTIAIIRIFINTFILKAGVSVGGMSPENVALVYNVIAFGSQPFFMVFAVLTCRMFGPRNSQKIGFVSYALCFVFIIIFGKTAAEYFWALALLMSCGAGFYYVSYASELLEYTTDENRDAASGVASITSSFINMFFPPVSGLILGFFAANDFTGYRFLFGAMLLIIALAFFANTKLTPLTKTHNEKDRGFYLFKVAKTMIKKKNVRLVLLMTVLKGFRVGTLSSFISILIFSAAMNETANSINSFICQVLVLLSGFVYGSLITPARRKKSIVFATTAVLVASVPLFFAQNLVDSGNGVIYIVFLILFGAVNEFSSIFLIEPVMNVYFSIVPNETELKGKAGEVHTFNEFFLATGETLGLFATILLNILFKGNLLAPAIAIVILTASQYLCAYIVGKVKY